MAALPPPHTHTMANADEGEKAQEVTSLRTEEKTAQHPGRGSGSFLQHGVH